LLLNPAMDPSNLLLISRLQVLRKILNWLHSTSLVLMTTPPSCQSLTRATLVRNTASQTVTLLGPIYLAYFLFCIIIGFPKYYYRIFSSLQNIVVRCNIYLEDFFKGRRRRWVMHGLSIKCGCRTDNAWELAARSTSDQSFRDGNIRRFTLKSSGKVYKTEICETVR